MTLTFNPRQALIWTHTMQKINVNSHGSKARVETNGRTDGHDRSHYLSRYMLSVNIRDVLCAQSNQLQRVAAALKRNAASLLPPME